MVIDEQGLIWLADPWLAGAVVAVVLSLFLWTHCWVVAGRPPRPRPMAIRLRRPRRRPTAQPRLGVAALSWQRRHLARSSPAGGTRSLPAA
ncbi:MAG TPA: hypothetical protein VEQ11_12150 [Chloroflexota bacterium]|nr:hypothetical protein [Chloroflexota bacterium]